MVDGVVRIDVDCDGGGVGCACGVCGDDGGGGDVCDYG